MQIKDDLQAFDSSLGLSLSCRSSINSAPNRRLDDAAAASSSSSSFYRQSHPLQLELLPLRPSSTSDARANVIPVPTASAAAATASLFWQPQLPVQHRAVVLDMNQVPEVNDGELGNARGAVSESTTTSLVMKRERERERSSEERTCEVSSRGSDEDGEGAMSGSRKKLRLTKEQSTLLEESFKEHSTLNPKQKAELARQLNLRPRQVEVWFQNRRARTKLKQTEVDCELLKRCCESLTEENRRLQKEVQELRALKVAPPCVISHDRFMPLPAATLTMCPSCERLATHQPPDTTAAAAASTPSAPHPLSLIPLSSASASSFATTGSAPPALSLQLHHHRFSQPPPPSLPSAAC